MESGLNLRPSLHPNEIRQRILEIAYSGSTVHIGCAFSIVETLVALYQKTLNLGKPPYSSTSPERDYLILSKGHGVMALYAVYEQFGWIQKSDLDQYFKDGSLFHGLVEAKTPGMEVCSGSLGHGLPIAVGMALGLKKKNSSQKVFCIVGDGEMNEGTMWESLLFATQHQLNNLIVIVDSNGFQAMGTISEVLNLEPFVDKFSAFGWQAAECNGHSIQAIQTQLSALENSSKPIALVARTKKGKGVSFMDMNNEWHYRRLTPELYEKALSEVQNTPKDFYA